MTNIMIKLGSLQNSKIVFRIHIKMTQIKSWWELELIITQNS